MPASGLTGMPGLVYDHRNVDECDHEFHQNVVALLVDLDDYRQNAYGDLKTSAQPIIS
jgi:hypothetical protein